MLKIESVQETNYAKAHSLPKCRHCNQEIDVVNSYLRITLYSAASKFRIFFHTECAEIFGHEIIRVAKPKEEEDEHEDAEETPE